MPNSPISIGGSPIRSREICCIPPSIFTCSAAIASTPDTTSPESDWYFSGSNARVIEAHDVVPVPGVADERVGVAPLGVELHR